MRSAVSGALLTLHTDQIIIAWFLEYEGILHQLDPAGHNEP